MIRLVILTNKEDVKSEEQNYESIRSALWEEDEALCVSPYGKYIFKVSRKSFAESHKEWKKESKSREFYPNPFYFLIKGYVRWLNVEQAASYLSDDDERVFKIVYGVDLKH